MFQSILQSVFITTIGIMVLGLIAPAFYTSDKKTDKLLSKFVVPIENAKESTQSFTVSHLEILLNQNHIAAENIVLVATDKGVYLLEKDNKHEARLRTLMNQGVQLYACEISQAVIKNKQSQQLLLVDGVKNIANGKLYIENLMEQGFTNSFA